METASDQDLVKDLMGGSHEAFSIIYEKYWKTVFQFALDRMGDVNQSQDVVQNVFISLWERKKELNIINLQAWLYASVRYGVLRAIGAGKAKDHVFTSLDQVDATSSPADDQLISAEMIQLYQAFVEQMPRQRRTILRMRHEENLQTKQIAEELRISRKTVQNHLLISYQEIRTLLNRVLFIILLVLLLLEY